MLGQYIWCLKRLTSIHEKSRESWDISGEFKIFSPLKITDMWLKQEQDTGIMNIAAGVLWN